MYDELKRVAVYCGICIDTVSHKKKLVCILAITTGCPKKSVNKEIRLTFELMNIVQGLHMFRHV